MAETQSVVRKRSGSGAAAARVVSALLILFAAACAPLVQRPGAGTPHGPHFDVEAQRFVSFDGAALGLTAWLPAEGAEPWAVIIGLHGMNDYARNFETVGPWFSARGVAVYAYDARGHGRSPLRGVWGGEALMTEDARTAVRVARTLYPHALIAVVGESMGAATAMAAFRNGGALGADRVVLASPAVWGWSTMPDLYALTLWTGAHTLRGRTVTAPRSVARRIIPSDNIVMLRALGRDPNMLFGTRVDAIYGLVNLMQDAAESAPALREPTLMLYGAHDMIVPRAAVEEVAARLPRGARTALYPHGYHMMLRDLQAETVYEDILAFLHDPAAPLPSGAAPIDPPGRRASPGRPPARGAVQANR